MAILDKIENDLDNSLYKILNEIQEKKILSVYEQILLIKILIGCCKYISITCNRSVKKKAKIMCKHSKKDQSFQWLIENKIIKGLNGNLTPKELREKLPENLKDIQASELTELLLNICKMNLFSRGIKTRRKRGKQTSTGYDKGQQPGVKSYYAQTEYLKNVLSLISRPYVLKLIYSCLLESKLLYRYLGYAYLMGIYMTKFYYENKNVKGYSLLRDSKQSEQLYKKFKDLDDTEMMNIVTREIPDLLKKIDENSPTVANLCIYAGIIFNLEEPLII